MPMNDYLFIAIASIIVISLSYLMHLISIIALKMYDWMSAMSE